MSSNRHSVPALCFAQLLELAAGVELPWGSLGSHIAIGATRLAATGRCYALERQPFKH